MLELIALGSLIGAAIIVLGLLAIPFVAVWLGVKLVFWTVKLLLKLIVLPLIVIPIGLVLALVIGLLGVVFVAALAIGLGLLVVPVLPLLLIGVAAWAIVKVVSRPTTVAG